MAHLTIESAVRLGDQLIRDELITEEQLAEVKRRVMERFAVFTAAIARGRSFSADQLARITDARVHVGIHAMELNLVDSIESFDEALRKLSSRSGGSTMSQATINPATQVATETASAVILMRSASTSTAPPMAAAPFLSSGDSDGADECKAKSRRSDWAPRLTVFVDGA